MATTTRMRRLVIAVGIASLGAQAIFVAGRPLVAEDPRKLRETQALERFLTPFDHPELRERLRSEITIGYASDLPVDTRQGRPSELRYYLAQHALAPVLIEERPDRRVVLANFQSKQNLLRFLDSRGAEVLVQVTPRIALVEMAQP